MVNGQWSMVNGQWSIVKIKFLWTVDYLPNHQSPITNHHSNLSSMSKVQARSVVILTYGQ
ncbi:hypothetical protein [Nostoc sp. TCL26-01]|uniref:hypothetical protein n=1 Tax=Nostoc sp. TCL26-01 TaxID=2576904 RepID=UPI0015BCEB0C|nr:hypothetical protein [Nostoc sp. TCL26-01]QLE58210.1 hypothetical protein FD725_23455 [Nostoc sp. TCL26-01]